MSSLRETVARPPELFGRRSSPKGLRSAGAHSAPRVESSTNRAVTRPCTLRKGLKRCNPSGMHNCTFIINCLPKKLPYNYQEILTRIETLRESAHIFKRVHVVPSFHCFEIIFALPKQWRLFTHCHQQGGWKVWQTMINVDEMGIKQMLTSNGVPCADFDF